MRVFAAVEGIPTHPSDRWSKDFLEGDKKRICIISQLPPSFWLTAQRDVIELECHNQANKS